VPLAPHYCNSVLVWQNRLVPILDLAAAIGLGEHKTSTSIACLLNYQRAPRQPLQQLALRVNKNPEKVYVDDTQAAELAEATENVLLESVALGCFLHGHQSIAVIDIAKLCTAEFRELVQTSAMPLTATLPVSELSQVDSR
jgi:chemotaxis signal transduction protein